MATEGKQGSAFIGSKVKTSENKIAKMRIPKIINKLGWPIKTLKYRRLNGIKSRKDFYKIIANERERANRNNHKVSLVVFNLDSFPDNGKERKQLINNINQEKRSIDGIGWYMKHSVGVILPYTSSHGAREFSVRVCQTLNFIMPDSFSYLFTYPLEEKTGDAENKADGQPANKPENDAEDTIDDSDNKTDDYLQKVSARNISS
jgi:hypothetical protein